MLYRMRIYQAVTENLPVFHEFFCAFLLPVQLRHGARLVGRWETEDGRVVAIWEYDDRAAYEQIEAAVRADPDSRRAQEHRRQLPALMTATDETFMSPTIEPVWSPLRRTSARPNPD
jgi:NIPSNAP